MTTARALPPALQDEIARLMLDFVGDDPSVYRFTPGEEAELEESEAAAARGDFATDEEVRQSGPSMACEVKLDPPN